MVDTTGRQDNNSTAYFNYDFQFHRRITYNVNNPINVFVIKIDIKKEMVKRFYLHMNKMLARN